MLFPVFKTNIGSVGGSTCGPAGGSAGSSAVGSAGSSAGCSHAICLQSRVSAVKCFVHGVFPRFSRIRLCVAVPHVAEQGAHASHCPTTHSVRSPAGYKAGGGGESESSGDQTSASAMTCLLCFLLVTPSCRGLRFLSLLIQ